MTSPAAAAAGGLKAPNSAPTTACWARSCRARQATGSQAAVTEASSLPVRMTWQRWHSMRSATPRPPPSVSVLTPLRELRGTFSPERLGAIQPLFGVWQCLIGVHCHTPKRQRLRWPRSVANSPRSFNSWVLADEHFVSTLSELGVQQALLIIDAETLGLTKTTEGYDDRKITTMCRMPHGGPLPDDNPLIAPTAARRAGATRHAMLALA